jgi:para-aminobenzoate synthetase/4-amino-4-deoxychorismate lyase
MADLILWNEEGFITESSIANIVIARKDGFFTPPIRQGLLPGIFRRHLLEQGVVKEKDISIDEMLRAQAIFLVNSVRGWMLLDKSNQDNTWVINSDFRYETPSMSFDGMVS